MLHSGKPPLQVLNAGLQFFDILAERVDALGLKFTCEYLSYLGAVAIV